MKINLAPSKVSSYLYLLVALMCTFWIISLYEVYSNMSNGVQMPTDSLYIFYKLTNDFWAVLFVGIIVAPLYLLSCLINKKSSLWIIKVIFIVVILGQLALVKYSKLTLLNLGADLLGYSMDDIIITIKSSSSVSLSGNMPMLIFPLLFLGLSIVLIKLLVQKQIYALSIVLVLLFGSIKLVVPELSNEDNKNKLQYFAADVMSYKMEQYFGEDMTYKSNNSFPLLKNTEGFKDVLSPFLQLNEEKPNIVFVIVEGLGTEFLGDNTFGGFTPYLDSLLPKSLYWENFVSTTGRTFGVVPSILGSLPFGEKGFLELNDPPSHLSLISILKANGYYTSFYTGDQSSFDRKINFLEYNGIDRVIDESKFGSDFVKTEGKSGVVSWGYPDAEIFRKTLSVLDEVEHPRLDVIMTVSNHEPFDFPVKEQYLKKVDSLLQLKNGFGSAKSAIEPYKDIFATLLYSDNAIGKFMNSYAERPDYENTIFVITGDHRLIPIDQKDKLCRFHVPLFIYSPMLTRTKRMKSIGSHWDIAPSLFSMLSSNQKINTLDEVAWMSSGLDTVKNFRNIHKIPLMRNKGAIDDFIFKDYLLSEGELYKINDNFGTYKVVEEALIKSISDSLINFKKMNKYVTENNAIFPDSLNIFIKPKVEFSEEKMSVINELSKGLNFDQVFILARELAFDDEYIKARLLCDYILSEHPNHEDARTLKGRTLAWEGLHAEAEMEFLNVLKRSPYYSDTYLALMDLYWWSDQDDKSIDLVERAIKNKIDDSEIGFKLARVHKRMNNLKEANQVIDSLITIQPDNTNFQTFKNDLK